MRPSLLASFALLFSATTVLAASPSARGRVVDEEGHALAGVVVRGGTAHAVTDASGRFTICVPDGADSCAAIDAVEVDDPRWRAAMQRVDPMHRSDDLRIVARAVAAAEEIVVTATRTPARLADTPASLVVVSHKELATSVAVTTDQALRQLPGFTLFRRTDSRVANPTAQGVSLRGIGASGASRAAVLDDGVPLNDPFGGWVYWSRVPREAISSIEVLRGGGAELYGSGAMGGVLQFVRRDDAVNTVTLDASGGTQRTAALSLFAAVTRASWSGRVAADLLSTRGYMLVVPDQRGLVDVDAASRHDAIDASLERSLATMGRAFVRASSYRESRENGTPLQDNDTTIRELVLGTDVQIAGGSAVVRAFGTDQSYAQTFSAVAADRNSERLTVDQHVPVRSRGASAQWSHVIGARNVLLAGSEWRSVHGASDEAQFGTRGTTLVDSLGAQRTFALFAEDVFALSRMTITAGLRGESWRNFDARRDTTAPGAALTSQPLASRSDTAWSPRVALLFRANDQLSLIASAYRAFRAPTLNELYRGFRVGNVQTNANESLGPERLHAIELGARLVSGDGRASIRANLFSMTIDDAIANVTLSTTPALITRQRANLGTTRSRGVEVESEWHVSRSWRATAGYLFADARVIEFATSRDLEGNRLPQVPRHQATLQLTHDGSDGAWWNATTASVQLRYSSKQFDDDQNLLVLGSYAVADVFIAHPLFGHVDATLALENVTGRRYAVAATPVINVGPPRAVRFGFRYH